MYGLQLIRVVWLVRRVGRPVGNSIIDRVEVRGTVGRSLISVRYE